MTTNSTSDYYARREALRLAVAFWAIPDVRFPSGVNVTDTARLFHTFLTGKNQNGDRKSE